MEQLGPPAFNPHLKRVLETYQNAAVRSLSGPSNYVAGWGDPSKMSPAEIDEYRMKVISTLTAEKKTVTDREELIVSAVSAKPHEFGPPPFPIQQVPLFMPMDSSRSEKSETILEGETIACFIVGGEKRLCLPQILNTVLRDFSLQQINNVCDDLHIFCSRCNPEQLDNLKMTNVLPISAPSCGLITKTDAERLCNALLHSAPEKSTQPPTLNSFKVYHECFGKCKGIFTPELYESPHARCIECCGCHGMFSPQKFVCHSHSVQENRTCHWGFDSANWRSYLLLSKDQENKSRLHDILDMIKARFDFMSKYKRKESPSPDSSDPKRARYDENKTDNAFDPTVWSESSLRHMSAFQPWGPSLLNALKEGKALQLPQQLRDGIATALPAFLQTGPPVLLNPERVIPHSESSRYERHFAPNVSLAPQSQQKMRIKEEVFVDGEKDSVDTTLNNSELNVSSDTEDSAFDNSATGSSSPKSKCAEVNNSYNLSKELSMLRTALNGEVENSDSAREKFIKDYIEIRRQQLDDYSATLQKNSSMQQEIEFLQSSKRHLAELTTENRVLEKELDSLRCEHEKKMAKMKASIESLQKERDSLHNHRSPDLVKNKAKYKEKIADLKMRLKQCEQSNIQKDQEIAALHNEWKKMGNDPIAIHKNCSNLTNHDNPKCNETINGENGGLVVSVKKEPTSDNEQSQSTP